MQAFYIQDDSLPIATLKQQGITRLSDTVPSVSSNEAAAICAVTKAYQPAVFSSNMSTDTSNLLYKTVQPTAVYSSNLSSTNSNLLFPLVSQALQEAQAAQTTADAGLAAAAAASTTATGAVIAAAEANSLAAAASAAALANQATLILHDGRITAAQMTADTANSAASTAQQSADKAQQTADHAVDKTKDWVFNPDSIQNLQQPTLSLTYSNDQYIKVNKSLQAADKLQADNAMVAPAWISPSNGECRYDNSQLKLKHTKVGATTADSKSGYLFLYYDGVEFKTQQSQAEYGSIAPQITQFSVDSNGTCYVASNIQMPTTAIIRATQTGSLDAPYREGIVRITPDALRFVSLSNDGMTSYEKQCFSVNSNGIFALLRCALLGREESVTEPDPNNPLQTITRTKFPRFEMTLNEGLRFGSGIQNQLGGPDRDLLKVDQAGVIYCMSQTSGLLEAITSNACPAKGGIALESTGLTVGNRPIITSAGELVRRVDVDSPEGFKVSPSGYLTMGGLQVNPQGVIVSSCNASFGTLTENGATLSNAYAPIQTYNLASNTSNTTGWASNLVIATSNIASWGSNTAAAASNRAYINNYWSSTGTSVTTRSNVGIGTAAPGYILDVQGNSRICNGFGSSTLIDSGNNNGLIRFCAVNGVNYLQTGLSNSSFSAAPLVVTSINAGNEWLRLTSTGSLGIGTNAPAYMLDVAGTANAGTLLEGGVSLSNKYASLPTATWSSNNLVAFSNYITPVALSGSNVAATANARSVSTSNQLVGTSNALTGVSNLFVSLSNSLSSTTSTVTSLSNFVVPLAVSASNTANQAVSAAQGAQSTADAATGSAAAAAASAAANAAAILSINAAQATQDLAIAAAQATATSAQGAASSAATAASIAQNTADSAMQQAGQALSLASSTSNSLFGVSNTSAYSSNALPALSNMSAYSSNALPGISNIAIYSSNALPALSNMSTFCSNNTGYWQRSNTLCYTMCNLAVGVNSTNYKLDVNGSSVINGRLSLLGSGYTTSYDHISLWHDGTNAYYDVGGLNAGGLTFRANVSETTTANLGLALYSNVMTLLPNGSVGIGTSNPTNKLDVIGTINGTTLSENNTALAAKYYSSSSGVWTSNLAVYSSNSSTFSSNVSAYSSNSIITFSNSITPIVLSSSNAAYYGSNTSVWSSNLWPTLCNTSNAAYTALSTAQTATNFWSKGQDIASGKQFNFTECNVVIGLGRLPQREIHLYKSSGCGMRFEAQGSISQQLDVGTNVTGGNWHYINGAGNYPLVFSAGSNERMRLTPDGLVGIGTSNPACTLDIVGNMGISGTNTLEFGRGISKEINAGKLGYTAFNNTFGIVGSGLTNGSRTVQIFDTLVVGSTVYSSDSNLKNNIQPFGSLLDKIGSLEAKSFQWRDDPKRIHRYKQGPCLGLLAQDVQTVCPEAVEVTEEGQRIEQTALNAMLLQLIKDLKNELDKMKRTRPNALL